MKKTLLFLLLPIYCLNAQSVNELYRESLAAYESKDFKRFLDLNLRMDSIRPMHPAISYNLALGFALNSDNANAFRILKRIAYANDQTAIEGDLDFATFLKSTEYNEIQRIREQLKIPVAGSAKIISLNEKTLHPEGLSYVEGTGWLAASVRHRKIVAFDTKTGNCSDWLSGDDMLAVFSIRSSADAKYLWAATAAVPEMKNYNKMLEGIAEVLKVDIGTKKIVKRLMVPGNHVFGDLVATGSGVYISDSASPVIYKIQGDSISEWLNLENEAFNLQGITTDGKGKLFVADYLKGICVISIKDKSHSWMAMPEGTTQKGIDGLTYFDNSLIAIHNGVSPIRIIRYMLNTKHDAIKSFWLIDHNRPEFNEPVLGTLAGDGFYFFGNSPWQAYDKSFNLDENAVRDPELYMYRLD